MAFYSLNTTFSSLTLKTILQSLKPVKAYKVAMKGLTRIKGTSTLSSRSGITKSLGKMNLSTFAKMSSLIPRGWWMDMSTNLSVMPRPAVRHETTTTTTQEGLLTSHTQVAARLRQTGIIDKGHTCNWKKKLKWSRYRKNNSAKRVKSHQHKYTTKQIQSIRGVLQHASTYNIKP